MSVNICSICGNTFDGFGNDPWPVSKNKEDLCCDECNSKVVIPARIRLLLKEEEEKQNG